MSAGGTTSDDDEFNLGSNAGSKRFPVHDCCEFEDVASLRRLIFVRQEESDENDDSTASSSSSSSSQSGSDDDSSSSDDNDSHAAARDAAIGHSPPQAVHQQPGTPIGATAAVAAGVQSIQKEASKGEKNGNRHQQDEARQDGGDADADKTATVSDTSEHHRLTPAEGEGSNERNIPEGQPPADTTEKKTSSAKEMDVGTKKQLYDLPDSSKSSTADQNTSMRVKGSSPDAGSSSNVEMKASKVLGRQDERLSITGEPSDGADIERQLEKVENGESEKGPGGQSSDLAVPDCEISTSSAPVAKTELDSSTLVANHATHGSSESDANLGVSTKSDVRTENASVPGCEDSINTMDISPVASREEQDKHSNAAELDSSVAVNNGRDDTRKRVGSSRLSNEPFNEDTEKYDSASGQDAKTKDNRKTKKKRKKKTAKKEKESSYYCPYDLNERDEDENTPLHVAIHSRKLEHVRLLLEAGASVHKKCDGSSPIHTAISIGSIPAHAAFSCECANVLREHGADLSVKDDSLHTPLYLACMMNLPRVVGLLLGDPTGMGTLNLRADRVGGRALHAAAKFDVPPRGGMRPGGGTVAGDSGHHHVRSSHHHGSVLHRGQHHHPGLQRSHSSPPHPIHSRDGGQSQRRHHSDQSAQGDASALLTQVLLSTPGIEVDPQNNYGRTPLHIACMRGNWSVARHLLNAGANPHIIDRRGYTPGQLAHKRGMVIPNDLLPVFGQAASFQSTPGRDLIIDPDGSTLVLCHEMCSRHRSCPPITRGTGMTCVEPPPENVRRLQVLINDDVGILRCGEFGGCSWETEARRAALADVLKVHEYTYVEKISQLCSSIPDHPSAIAQLDPDTAVSRWSFEAALRAAGSVCEAVDRVVAGDFRNAFCAVRPPGHHAGPRGIVKCANDPEGSHGFCLLNNVAVGAAYARSMYRNDGLRKVAIIDFDVHHGNGTEEIVRQLVPGVEQVPIRTPFAVGGLQTSKYRPWLDENDIHDVFFASTHGYGPKEIHFADHVQPGGWFYPASGKTVTTDAILNPSTVENPSIGDFLLSQTWTRMGEESRMNCCKIINCGLDLPRPHDTPGMQRVELRDAYRKNILPHLMDFDPDIIFISAGFDAHKKDTMNFGYVGMIEDDYEWVTEQLVKVANTCCNGRIVSVLEGGYKIHGGIVSPFARSVASHVRALVDGGSSRDMYDAQEGEWESQFERHMVEEKEKKRQMKIDKLHKFAQNQQRQFHHTRHHHTATEGQKHGQQMQGNQEMDAILKEPLNENHGHSVGHSDSNDGKQQGRNKQEKVDEVPTRKRRRFQVDYKELYEQMKKEGFAA